MKTGLNIINFLAMNFYLLLANSIIISYCFAYKITVEPSEVCQNVFSEFDGSIVSCDINCVKVENDCYHTIDLDVLRDLRDNINLFNQEVLLNIGKQQWDKGRLVSLDLSNSKLTNFPKSIKNLSLLVQLSLNSNLLKGEIPKEISELKNLQSLYLSNNYFSGDIPEFLCNIPEVFLHNNNLCAVPECFLNIYQHLGENNWQDKSECNGNIYPDGYINLWGRLYEIDYTTKVDLNGESLRGKIPSEIGKLINLTHLHIEGNQLDGEIPPEIGNLTKLVSLKLLNNNLTGKIPPEIGNLKYLELLWLPGNQLTGEIPMEIGNLINLKSLLLGGNKLTTIPPKIGNLTNLKEFSLYNNELRGQIPIEICNILDSNPELQKNRLCPYTYPDCLPRASIEDQDTWGCIP